MVDYQFLPNPSIAAPTILYVPPLIYPSGYSIEVELLNWKISAIYELSSAPKLSLSLQTSPNINWVVDETQSSLVLITSTNSDMAHIVLRPKEM